MADPIVQAATALVWLTRLPVGRCLPETPPPLAAAAWAFPLVGVVLGAGAGLVLALAAGLGLPPLACALLALAAGMALTGALHEDGLADFADGCGARDRARALEIMRDSRIGSYGTIALLLSLGLRAAALAALAPGQGVLALIGAAALSRAGMAAALAFLPPARPDGLGRGAGRPTGAAVAVGLLIAALALVPAGGVLPALFACGLVQYALARLALRRLGGQTGDVLGAVQQVGEIAALLALAAT